MNKGRSTEEGGRAEMVVRKNSGADKSSFVPYCPFNPNVMCVGEQGSTEEGGRADYAGGEGAGPQDAAQTETSQEYQESAHSHHWGQGLLPGKCLHPPPPTDGKECCTVNALSLATDLNFVGNDFKKRLLLLILW